MDVPTAIVGITQSGKTWRAFRLFEAHPEIAIFVDVQWRAEHYSPGHPIAYDVEEVVEHLRSWKGGPLKIVWRGVEEDPEQLDEFIRYALGVHRAAHVRNRPLPRLAIFVDEVSLLADRWAPNENAVVRLFTQGYQHSVIGVVITQRPAQTSRNILGNAWDRYVFSMSAEDVMSLRRVHGWDIPDDDWIVDPKAHRYLVYRGGRWYRGDPQGVEHAVEVSELRREDEGPVREDDDVDGAEDVEGGGDVPLS